MREATADQIINSKLLILQSKRLLLTSAERRLGDTGVQSLRAQVEQLRIDTATAQHGYRSSVLQWGSPRQRDYWLIAYSRLIEMGNALMTKLRSSAPGLPADERCELTADMEMLEGIVEGWTESKRRSMTVALA
jgi:hypothetical protein